MIELNETCMLLPKMTPHCLIDILSSLCRRTNDFLCKLSIFPIAGPELLPLHEGDPQRHQAGEPAAGHEGRPQDLRLRVVGARPQLQEGHHVRDPGLSAPGDDRGPDPQREGGPLGPGHPHLRVLGGKTSV